MPSELADQTNRFLDLLEVGDSSGIAAMLDDQIVWSTPMSSGTSTETQPARGRKAFGARLGTISGQMRSAKFIDRRVTTSADGATTFVQTKGDFLTADGRPYQNVYVFRFDWDQGRIKSWEEYANPLTIIRTFPDEYGHFLEGLLSKN